MENLDLRRKRTAGGLVRLCASLIGGVAIGLGVSVARAALAQPVLPLQVPSSVAIPPEGNPYGLSVVPPNFPQGGVIHPGQLLVANFNNSAGQQGLGTTIDVINPISGAAHLFFQVSGNQTPGFSNALGIASAGFVFAGTVLTTDGTDATAAPGDLYVLDRAGQLVMTIAPGGATQLDGPWGLAINDLGSTAQIFVSNVFSGKVVRLDVSFSGDSVTVHNSTIIADGYSTALSTGAIVVGPAGLAFDKAKDILYVSAENDNEIFAIAHASRLTGSAGKGHLVFDNAALNGPLGLVIATNGDLITANADSLNSSPAVPSALIEFTAGGTLVREFSIDPNPGSAFAILSLAKEFAYVDDFSSNVTIWRFPGMH